MPLLKQLYRPQFIAGLLAAIGLLGLTLAVFSGPSASAARDADTSATVGSSPSAAPLQTKGGTYSVFAREATAGDDISGWRIPRNGVDAKVGMRFAEARVVYRDDTKSVAAVPTSSDPCLVSQYRDGSGGLTCSPTFTHGVSVGLVPDSVKSVTYAMTDGSTQVQEVTDNLWHSPTEAAQVTYVLDGVAHTEDLLPLSALPQGASISPSGLVSSPVR